MNQEKRLKELLTNINHEVHGLPGVNAVTDYLLRNGVIVPPCKVGDTVYRIYTRSWIGEDKITHFFITEQGLYYVDDKGRETSCDKFGKLVFTNKEEAEQVLKGGAK